jgi:hypothetical protein
VTGGNRAAAFSLLVDESASMKGQEKFKVATKAAVLLGETLELLDVPLEIIGYSTADFEARAAMQLGLTPAHEYRHMRCSRLEHRIYKRFSEPYASAHLRLTGIQPRCNNWDEEHLMFAFQRLQERQEPRKLMVVISDGQPNGDADNLIHTVAHRAPGREGDRHWGGGGLRVPDLPARHRGKGFPPDGGRAAAHPGARVPQQRQPIRLEMREASDEVRTRTPGRSHRQAAGP